ncbi:MAG: hypothetical protein CSA21_01915 [Deltaproteobacteria bacterium]|nr:MAG: hypothetical protein CSA21_01915 [Deltaproteobacteria bacterium]
MFQKGLAGRPSDIACCALLVLQKVDILFQQGFEIRTPALKVLNVLHLFWGQPGLDGGPGG